ncbi:hypothetical protein FACS1894201_05290 [Bacteroidia bacterium]|nr:hypothetical protein FACS1894201_05290 [Bacteroidia bacterium]
MNKKILLLALLTYCLIFKSYAQIDAPTVQEYLGGSIPTSVPFLTIAPDARAGALGDIGVASSPDANSQHWNAAKYAFIEDQSGVSLTYSPWLRGLVSDMNLLYLSGYYRLNERSTFAGSLRFFTLGEIIFRQDPSEPGYIIRPNEYAVDLSYSNKLTDNFSVAVAGRFIRSDLTKGYSYGTGSSSKAAQSVAADVAMFYQKDIELDALQSSSLALGLNISNIGAKLSYSESARKDFLPTTLRFGGAFTAELDKFNKLTAYLEISKLLVPTPPYMSGDTIIAGYDPDVGTITGMVQSFYDAPDGFKEELTEYIWSLGAEYLYSNVLAFRGGYLHDAKGSKQYATVGLGLKFNVVTLDLSYLMPTGKVTTHPLKNTLRISVKFSFSEYRAQHPVTPNPIN